MKKLSAVKLAVVCGVFALGSLSSAEMKDTSRENGKTSPSGWSSAEGDPTQSTKSNSSYWSRWDKGTEWKPYAQLGGRAMHASASPYKMPSVIETELQAGVWYENYVGVYVYGSTGLIRNDSTTYGGGVKVPFYSSDVGADSSSFLSGLSVYAVADLAKNNAPRPASAATDYDKDPTLFRWGVGTNLGVGPWGTYVDASLMMFSKQGHLHWAPMGAIGYLF